MFLTSFHCLGKYCLDEPGKITLKFAIQFHHGFVDGYHIHPLGEKIKMSIEQMISLELGLRIYPTLYTHSRLKKLC